ncbi:TetR family transcriptional regulator [Acidimicrobiaceae bacterium USS-CC1]|uniref:TetR family transcriptional regulator n=1 Tax=Acidiferrimicrobium australe TaxID=2664430 RepID=A0ABW9QQC7_9ACTN|nr:TetR family transcriptional regulator [Acidiferrimicrobium australe]
MVRPQEATGPAAGNRTDGRRGEILAVATRLFARSGFHGVGMRAIAEAVGVQTSSLYHYFPSKTDILYAISRDATAAFIAAQSPRLEEAGAAPAETLRAVFSDHVRYFHAHREEEAVGLRELRELEPPRFEEINALRRGYQDAVRRVVAEGQRAGVFAVADPTLATLAVLGLLNSVNDWYRDGGPRTIDEVAEAYAGMAIERLLGAGPRGRPAP